YLRNVIAAGLDVDQCAPRMSFFFGIGIDFYTEIAKLRASRVIWNRIVNEFGAKNPKSSILRMHCQTSGWSLTQQDPMNNIVRTSIEAMAGVFGGTQSMHTNSFDEATCLPSDTAARIARNTQLILQEETGITQVVDPWGGSYFMESLTQQLVDRANELMDEVESFGGMAKAIELGLPKLRIEEAAAIEQAKIDRGERVIVGVNQHTTPDSTATETVVVDGESVQQQQQAKLQGLRSRRDQQAVEHSLAAITDAAQSSDVNLVPLAIQAMRNGATVGEVSTALETVWGRHQDESILVSGVYQSKRREDDRWKTLSQRVESFTQSYERPPRILICKLGQDGHDRGQRVVASALADLGFEVVLAPLFATPDDVTRMSDQSGVDVVGISTLAAGHQTLLPQLMRQLSDSRIKIPVVVGGVIPDAERESLARLGVRQVYGPATPIDVIASDLITLAEQNRTRG
ncbi:MAG: methylmalonyl-CoA mutase family protein, partial [Rubripirellula sp.]